MSEQRELHWAVPKDLSRDKVGNMIAAWNRIGQYEATLVEEEFIKRFGEAEAFAYLRSFEAMGSFQIAEVLPRFSILDARTVANAISSPEPPAFMAEEAHSHTATNYFGIPLGIAFPYWMG